MEMMCGVLTRCGMRSCCQSMKCHLTVSWKAQNKTQMRESDQLKTVLALYYIDILQKDMPPSYQRAKSMVKKFVDQIMRARNFEARNETTATRTQAKSRSKGK